MPLIQLAKRAAVAPIKWSFATALLLVSPLVLACPFPDSDRGEAPAWLCGEPQFEGAQYTAVGDKSRVPSISLQNRLAGKAAMVAVTGRLLEAGRDQLLSKLPPATRLTLPEAGNLSVVARFDGIRVLEKTQSPRRHLYVLAGVHDDEADAQLAVACREVVSANHKQLRKAMPETDLAALCLTAKN